MSRLTEDPNVTVGVIEAGQYVPDMPQINIPGTSSRRLAPHLVAPAPCRAASLIARSLARALVYVGMAGSGIMNERIDWRFMSVPQPAVDGRVIPQPRCALSPPSRPLASRRESAASTAHRASR